MNKGMSCKYVRFHHPVPRWENDEPVSEFRLEGKQTKYLVDSIEFTKDCVIAKAAAHTTYIPLANVIYVRPKD